MRYCLKGNLFVVGSKKVYFLIGLLWLVLIQALSVVGGNPALADSIDDARSDDVAGDYASQPTPEHADLRFEESTVPQAREGYATLRWNAIAAASEYQVIDADAKLLYRGSFPQAFISGLENGKHRFTVTAIDASGQPLATSAVPATVTVEHWPLGPAVGLLGVGGVVFTALIGLLVYGAVSTRSPRETGIDGNHGGSA